MTELDGEVKKIEGTIKDFTVQQKDAAEKHKEDMEGLKDLMRQLLAK